MLNRQQSISHGINKNRWNFTVRLFHWMSVLLLVTTWLFVFLHNNLDDSNHIYILWHRSLGLLFLVWVITRLLNRIGTSDLKPSEFNTILWQKYLASTVHFLLYIAMIGMPITGFLMTQYGGTSVSFFGLFNIPTIVKPDQTMKHYFLTLHTDLIWTMLWSLSLLHILSALFHQFVKKEKLINRML
jgi:cytochrome b561